MPEDEDEEGKGNDDDEVVVSTQKESTKCPITMQELSSPIYARFSPKQKSLPALTKIYSQKHKSIDNLKINELAKSVVIGIRTQFSLFCSIQRLVLLLVKTKQKKQKKQKKKQNKKTKKQKNKKTKKQKN